MIARHKCKRLTGYEVEYIAKKDMPMEEGEAQFDDAVSTFKDFDTKTQAVEYAKSVVHDSFFGSVSVRAFTMQPISDRYRNVLEREYSETDYTEIS